MVFDDLSPLEKEVIVAVERYGSMAEEVLGMDSGEIVRVIRGVMKRACSRLYGRALSLVRGAGDAAINEEDVDSAIDLGILNAIDRYVPQPNPLLANFGNGNDGNPTRFTSYCFEWVKKEVSQVLRLLDYCYQTEEGRIITMDEYSTRDLPEGTFKRLTIRSSWSEDAEMDVYKDDNGNFRRYYRKK